MGSRSIRLPDVGEGVAEAEVAEWMVKVGDAVREDQVVVAVMTDKATVEIPTPVAGMVVALGGEVGQVLAVGSELIRIEGPDIVDRPMPPPIVAKPAAPAAKPATLAMKLEEAPNAAKPGAPENKPAAASEPPPPPEPSPAAPRPRPAVALSGPPRAPGEKPLASPAVRLAAREAGIDLRFVPGSGPAGRVTHDDLDAHGAHPPQLQAAPAGRHPDLSVETIKVTGLRRRIAQAMAESSRRIAHFSYVEEIDVTALEDLRATLNAEATVEKPRLTILPFLMLAIVKAVASQPQMNAHFDDDNDLIQRYGAVHMGVATQTPNGLMVPVVRHAETLGLHAIAREMRRVSEAARQGIATREELSGSTITLTSLGALGGIVSTPIINRPEVAIVGVNKIVVRPIWRDGDFVARKMMNLSSSFDHRVVDGHDAASFIQRIRGLVEAPALLFIQD